MMDADKNGKLSMDELRKALERIGGHIENEDLLALFQHIDHNKDGKIDFNEARPTLLVLAHSLSLSLSLLLTTHRSSRNWWSNLLSISKRNPCAPL
jgi:hypothetical protein